MSNSVVALLQLALSLLIAAQQPNVPENLKIQAISTANYAISYAQSELHKDSIQTPLQAVPTCTLKIATSTSWFDPSQTMATAEWNSQNATSVVFSIGTGDNPQRFVPTYSYNQDSFTYVNGTKLTDLVSHYITPKFPVGGEIPVKAEFQGAHGKASCEAEVNP